MNNWAIRWLETWKKNDVLLGAMDTHESHGTEQKKRLRLVRFVQNDTFCVCCGVVGFGGDSLV